MERYLDRICPKCGDYFGVVMPTPQRKSTIQPVNGLCVSCGYQLRWQLIRGGYTRQKNGFRPRMPKRFYDG
jgi:hypothetical protein